jgi:hypothetical protein
MNSQDFDYLSREIESIRRELGAGIPVPEKKAAEAASSDLITFASMKNFSGASETGWATEYMDGDTGQVLTYFLARTIGHVPTTYVDFSNTSSLDTGEADPVNSGFFCYDVSNTGTSLDLYYLHNQNAMAGYSQISNAIPMTKVTSSRVGSSALNRAVKVTEINTHYEATVDGAGILVYPRAKITSEITNYSITDVVPGANGSFSIGGDHTSEFTNGASFFVTGSTGNDKTYVVASSSYDSGDDETTIIVAGSIADATVDGSLGTGGGCLALDEINVSHLLFTQGAASYSGLVYYSSKNNNWYTTKSAFHNTRELTYSYDMYFHYHDETGTVVSEPINGIGINPISVPDSFVSRGRVCIEQISPRSNTLLVRLRHRTTGDLYEGTVGASVVSNPGVSVFLKYGTNAAGMGRFFMPTPGQTNPENVSIFELDLTMSTLPNS